MNELWASTRRQKIDTKIELVNGRYAMIIYLEEDLHRLLIVYITFFALIWT